MPGFVIHIAVGKEYIKKHKNEIPYLLDKITDSPV